MAKPLIFHDQRDWHGPCNALGNTGHRPPAEDQTMTDHANLLTREDTLLGVCEGLGEELGVPPMLLRVAFAVGLFWNPLAMVVGYLALGAALALFRWAFPPRRAAAPQLPVERPAANNDADVTWAEAA